MSEQQTSEHPLIEEQLRRLEGAETDPDRALQVYEDISVALDTVLHGPGQAAVTAEDDPDSRPGS